MKSTHHHVCPCGARIEVSCAGWTDRFGCPAIKVCPKCQPKFDRFYVAVGSSPLDKFGVTGRMCGTGKTPAVLALEALARDLRDNPVPENQ